MAQYHDPNEVSTVYVPDDDVESFDTRSFALGVFIGAAAVAIWAPVVIWWWA